MKRGFRYLTKIVSITVCLVSLTSFSLAANLQLSEALGQRISDDYVPAFKYSPKVASKV